MYRLEFKWTISRGRDTYGYNICSLWLDGNKVSSCNGGGYDMEGTALADWIESAFQDELILLGSAAHSFYESDASGKFKGRFDNPGHGPRGWIDRDRGEQFYGMSSYCHLDGKVWKVAHVHLDGACGFESICQIVKALGYGLQYVSETKKSTAYIMAPSAAIEALHGIHG